MPVEIGGNDRRWEELFRFTQNVLGRVSARYVRKDEPTDACLDGELSRLSGGQVTMGTRDGGVALKEGRLDH